MTVIDDSAIPAPDYWEDELRDQVSSFDDSNLKRLKEEAEDLQAAKRINPFLIVVAVAFGVTIIILGTFLWKKKKPEVPLPEDSNGPHLELHRGIATVHPIVEPPEVGCPEQVNASEVKVMIPA